MAKNKQSQQAINSIIGDLTFSNSDVWVWVKIEPAQFEFQDYKSQEKIARDFDLAISNLLSSDEKSLECHLIVSSSSFDSKTWVKKLNDRAIKNEPLPENPRFLSEMHSYVQSWQFRNKVVYLGVNLGKRTDFSTTNSILPVNAVTNFLGVFAGVVDSYVSDKELAFWDGRAKNIRNSLYTSRIKGQRVYAEDIAYIIRKNFYPAMPAPTSKDLVFGESQIWGEGELNSLVDVDLVNGPRFLKMTQLVNGVERSGYRATLCFNKFPEVMSYPERSPWIHYASLLGFPVDIYSRFTLEPSRKVRKEVNRKLKEVQDQAENQKSASGGGVSMQVQENLNLGTELDYALGKNTTPWVFGYHRIIVEAPTEELLKERATAVIDHYKGLDLFVVWPTGDQLSLLMESLPSDKIRVPSYRQYQELSIISAGVPAGSGGVGDTILRKADGKELGWIGSYMGHTTGTTVEPVFLSLHSAIAKNNPGGAVITGAPGGGKALSLDTPIPTPTGWTAMGDLKIGDTVFDENGLPCSVTFTTPVMNNHKVYEVVFSDGSIIKADAEHRWFTETMDGKSGIKNTEEILSTLKSGGYLNHSIPTAKPLMLPELETEEHMYAFGASIGKIWTSSVKRIPSKYLRASIPERAALLHGILSEARIALKLPVGNHYTSTNRGLAHDVEELANSLGLITEFSQVKGESSTVYGVSVNAVAWSDLKSTMDSDALSLINYSRVIMDVRPIPSVPVRCITVDSPSHLYLAGKAMIPTHNTFTAFTMTYQMALAGVWTIYIDPKADAIPMVNLPGMEDARLIDLKNGNDGILDPFSIGTNASEKKELALETISLFLGGQNAMLPREKSELSKAIQIIAAQPQPSLNKIVDYLLASPNPEAESLGQTLNFIRELPFARLCFSPKTQDILRADKGLTIITLLGLDLPNSSAPADTYTNANRLAVAVMFLLTSFTRQLMFNLDKSHPKAIVIDEAWAVTSTPQGSKLVFEVARMGRSLNTGLVLVSQNAGDFLGEGITNSVATKLAFRATNTDEIDNVLRFFNLDLQEGNRDVIRELKNGECLIKDADGRIARVQIDGWNEKMNYAFETNPETRKTT
jgi:AAA-like domain